VAQFLRRGRLGGASFNPRLIDKGREKGLAGRLHTGVRRATCGFRSWAWKNNAPPRTPPTRPCSQSGRQRGSGARDAFAGRTGRRQRVEEGQHFGGRHHVAYLGYVAQLMAWLAWAGRSSFLGERDAVVEAEGVDTFAARNPELVVP